MPYISRYRHKAWTSGGTSDRSWYQTRRNAIALSISGLSRSFVAHPSAPSPALVSIAIVIPVFEVVIRDVESAASADLRLRRPRDSAICFALRGSFVSGGSLVRDRTR